MNNEIENDCQQITNNDGAPLSGDHLARPTRSKSSLPAAVVDEVCAGLDAISAAFAMTPDTAQALNVAVLTPGQLDDLDAALANFEAATAAPADFGGEAEEAPRRHARLRDEFQAKHQADIARNKKHGHIAQGLDAIDEHRKTPKGRADYNANRRLKRHEQAAANGDVVRQRVRYATDEERREARRTQRAASKANRSPAQVEKERLADSARKAASRLAVKHATDKAISDKGIF